MQEVDELPADVVALAGDELEAALEAYPGCVVLVTHDEGFARKCTSRVLRVEGGTVL